MEQEMRQRLTQGGVDVDGVLERLMGSEALLERFLKKFLNDPTYESLLQAFQAGSPEQALTASHTLKGMCGNLSMTDLTQLFTRQVALLRAGDFAGAQAMLPDIAQAYDRAAQAIRGCWA